MSATKSEDAIGATGRPFTGAEYLKACATAARSISMASGSRTSPPIRPSATPRARSPGSTMRCTTRRPKDVLTCPTDTGSGGFTHKFFRVRALARGPDRASATPSPHWARLSYGWMGRTPDYKASLMNTLGANADSTASSPTMRTAWYKRAQEHVLFMNHAIVNPPVDRIKPPDQVKDVFITMQKETDAGIVVSGAKVVATSAALTHYNFMGQNSAMPTTNRSAR